MRVLHLVNPLMKGEDVKDVQRLLTKKGYLTPGSPPNGDVDGEFGPKTGQACEDVKRYVYGYPESQCRPTCGEKLLGYLSGKSKPPKSWQERAKKRKMQLTSEAGKRKKIVEYCRWGIANEPKIHYAQERPMEMSNLKKLPTNQDCSEFATKAYAFAKAPDPNGNKYSGDGYTGTLLRMKHITRSMLKAGDLIVFGPGTGHHVVIALEDGYNPMCASHGMEQGPLAIRLSDEIRFQPSPVTCLTLDKWS